MPRCNRRQAGDATAVIRGASRGAVRCEEAGAGKGWRRRPQEADAAEEEKDPEHEALALADDLRRRPPVRAARIACPPTRASRTRRRSHSRRTPTIAEHGRHQPGEELVLGPGPVLAEQQEPLDDVSGLMAREPQEESQPSPRQPAGLPRRRARGSGGRRRAMMERRKIATPARLLAARRPVGTRKGATPAMRGVLLWSIIEVLEQQHGDEPPASTVRTSAVDWMVKMTGYSGRWRGPSGSGAARATASAGSTASAEPAGGGRYLAIRRPREHDAGQDRRWEAYSSAPQHPGGGQTAEDE